MSRAARFLLLSLAFFVLSEIACADDAIHIGDDFKQSFFSLGDRQNQMTLLAGTLTFVGARFEDPSARDYFSGQQRLGGLDTVGNNVLGTGIPGVVVGLGLFGVGEYAGNSKAAHAGVATIEALAVNLVVTDALKVTIRRPRPNGSDPYSFPSGHVSTVATSAMVLEEFYGWRAGAPAFALTALTLASRLSANDHWLSDGIAGATVGILVGHAFAKTHLDQLSSAKTQTASSLKEWLLSARYSPEFFDGGLAFSAVLAWPERTLAR